ncbi:multidrug resistance-associated protein 1-like [Elysia marginata]|uniref:Multidrug resistance-associated protein 1-like n=1 Tax=Elysia marginata TaxID=1093978 RepID=A0AAV4F576_9GAST|nr:multidrug resistance-associated protein 1-like [Elysia marginata]
MKFVSSEQFCGHSEFWNASTITEHWYPKLSECFQQTALTYGPCGWLWLTAGLHLAYLKRHTRFVHLPPTWLHTARLVVALLLCVTSGIFLISPLLDDDGSYPPSYFLCHSLWLITYVYRNDVKRYSVETLTFALVLLEFGLQLVGDKKIIILHRDFYRITSPAMTASFISKLTFSWVFRMIYQGYKKVVVMSDIFDVPGYQQCRHNVPAFQAAWDKELQKKKGLENIKKSNTYLSPNDIIEGHKAEFEDNPEPTEKTRLLPKGDPVPENDGDSKGNGRSGQTKPSLLRALLRVFFLPLFKALVVGLAADALQFVNPLLLR